MEAKELAELIKSRRSIRSFQDTPVSEELLLHAIDTATWAPNGGNSQNWRFLIILDIKMIRQIGEVIEEDLGIIKSWPEMANAGPGGGRMGNPQPGGPLTSAPALIVVSALRGSDPMLDGMRKRSLIDPEAKRRLEGLEVVAGWAQTTSAAVAYLMLVLHLMGLGTLWMTGPLHAKSKIEKLLNFPADLELMTLVPVGYPAESPIRTRKPVGDVCSVIK